MRGGDVPISFHYSVSRSSVIKTSASAAIPVDVYSSIFTCLNTVSIVRRRAIHAAERLGQADTALGQETFNNATVTGFLWLE
jgi:hypothetical protein